MYEIIGGSDSHFSNFIDYFREHAVSFDYHLMRFLLYFEQRSQKINNTAGVVSKHLEYSYVSDILSNSLWPSAYSVFPSSVVSFDNLHIVVYGGNMNHSSKVMCKYAGNVYSKGEIISNEMIKCMILKRGN